MGTITDNITAYIPDDYSKVCLLDTDIIEPELLVRKIADTTAKEYPECFQGEAPLVFFRIRYTPPYDNFTELKRLILQIRQATGIRSRFRGMLCIDVSEYKGHEDEEYFTILLKYLYDNSRDNTLVFVCSQYTEPELNRLANTCAKYFPVHNEKLMIFERENLSRLVQETCKLKNLSIDSDALTLITTALSSPLLSAHRSLQLIERIPGELITMEHRTSHEKKRTRKITKEKVIAYFSDSTSSICILAGNTLLQERENDFEHTF